MLPQGWMYRTFYTLMAMTLAYIVVTMTVSKCCYRCAQISFPEIIGAPLEDGAVALALPGL